MKSLSELTAPAELPALRLLEKDIQGQSVTWARARGYWARKFSSQSQRSVPDYLFRGRGVDWATEFKAPGKTSTEAQLHEQKLMRESGWTVFECDNVDAFKAKVIAMEKGQ